MGTSLEPVLVKYFALPISPLGLIVLKSLAGGVLMAPLYHRLNKISGKHIQPLFWVSGLAFLTNALVFFSLTYLPATVVVTIITTTPLLVAFVHHRRGFTPLTPFFLASFFVVIIGVVLTIGLFEDALIRWSSFGVLIAFTSVLASAVYRLRMERLTHIVDPLSVSCGVFAINGFASLLLLPFVEIPVKAIPLGAWLGLAGALANVVFLMSLKHLGAIRVSMLSLSQRPMAVIVGAFLLKEDLSLGQSLGIILIFVGIFSERIRFLKPQWPWVR